MKSLLFPISIFVGVIAFIFIIDHRAFNYFDDIEIMQCKSNDAIKPNVASFALTGMTSANDKTKAVEEKHAERKWNPVLGTKTLSGRIQKDDSNEMIKAKPEPKPTPSAIPVATPEEAEQANKEALALLAAQTTVKKEDERKETLLEQKPIAVPVLSLEDANKANKEAISYYRKKAIKSFFRKTHNDLLNNNLANLIFSFIPLLFVADLLFRKKKEKPKNKKNLQRFSLPRRASTLLSVCLFSFGLLVFIPWSVYFGNSLQFPFIFQDFVNWNLRILTITILGTTLVLLFIPAKISDYLVAAIAGLGLCLYIQAMFMNCFLGEMNGVEPQWGQHRIWGFINIAIWIIIILIPFIVKKWYSDYFTLGMSCITGIVLFLEVLATCSMVISASQKVWSRSDSFFCDGSDQFQLSNDKNILVIIFDTLGSEFVKQCFDRYPETKEIVKDFTWYTDARSNYVATFPGLHHELTGTYIKPADNLHDLFYQSWHSPSAQSFYKQISDAGFDARLYCNGPIVGVGPLDCYHEYFSNIQAKHIDYSIDHKKLHKSLVQISLFSSAPFLLKKRFFYPNDFFDNIVQQSVGDISPNQSFIPNSNNAYLIKLNSTGILPNSAKPVFAVHYTYGVHQPWKLEEECHVVEEAFTEPVPTTKSCFYLLSKLFQRLKETGLYDRTAILVCSDHGGNTKNISTPFDMTFMVKPFAENKSELSYSDLKIQSIDILPTLLSFACGNKADYEAFDGYTPSNIPADRNRKVYETYYNKDFPRFWGDEEDKTYKVNCLIEYNFVNVESFRSGIHSSSFNRFIQLKKETENK